MAKNLALCNARLVISARRKDELVRVKRDCLGMPKSCILAIEMASWTLLTASNLKLKDKDILVLDFDMLDYSVHESCFKKVVNHFGKVSATSIIIVGTK